MKRNYILLVAAFYLVFCGIPFIACARNGAASIELRAIESELLELLNRERVQRSLPPIADHKVLGRVSVQHSKKMAREDTLSHDFPGYKSLGERLEQAGLFFIKAGENVAYSQGHVPGKIHQGFMDSPAHRDNILDADFTHCSIRAVYKNRDLWVTQEFARLFTPLSREEIAGMLMEHLGAKALKLTDVSDYAEFCARENLLGRKVTSFNEKWGNFWVVNMLSPELAKLKKGLKKQAKKVDFWGAEIGVAFDRHHEFPGGTYSVVALLFPGNKYLNTPDEKLVRRVLKVLNKLRTANGCRALNYSKTLSGEALKLAERFYHQPDKPLDTPRTRQVLVFQSSDPKDIPARFESFLLKRRQEGRVGIGLFCPLKHGIPGNFFITAIVISDL